MKLKKGSAAAKAYMAKIRAKRKTKTKAKTKPKQATFKPSFKKATKKKRKVSGVKSIGSNYTKYALNNYKHALEQYNQIKINLEALQKAYKDKIFVQKMGGNSYKLDLKRKIKIFKSMLVSQKKNLTILKKHL